MTKPYCVYDFLMIAQKLANIKSQDKITETFKVDVTHYPVLKYKSVYLMFNVMDSEPEPDIQIESDVDDLKKKRDAEISLRQEN